MNPILILLFSQLVFSFGDLCARWYLGKYGFTAATILTPAFVVLVLIHLCALMLQFYVLSQVQLGKTMALFGMTSILISNILGFFLLHEILSPIAYVGVVVALCAFLILAVS